VVPLPSSENDKERSNNSNEESMETEENSHDSFQMEHDGSDRSDNIEENENSTDEQFNSESKSESDSEDDSEEYIPSNVKKEKVPELFSQKELNDLVRDLGLPKDGAELLAATLKKKHLIIGIEMKNLDSFSFVMNSLS